MTDLESPDLVVEGRPPTAEEELLVKVWDDGFGNTIVRLNESINRLITLATAMAAGALGVLKDDVCTGLGRIIAASLFFLALTTAITASVPYFSEVWRELNAMSQEYRRIVRWKRLLLWTSYGFLVGGFAAAVIGTAWKTFA